MVGLLRDSYVDLPSGLVDQLVQYFIEREELEPSFAELFALQTVQRKLKDAGRFVFIDRVKKNGSFLPHIPASLRYVARALERLPHLGSLRAILGEHLKEFK